MSLDRKSRIEMGAIAVGVVMLGIIVSLNLRGGKGKPVSTAAIETRTGQAAVPLEHGAVPAVEGDPEAGLVEELGVRNEETWEQQMAILKEPWGKDPFHQTGKRGSSAQISLELKGISLTGSGQAFAIVNDSIVREGDSIGGYVVKQVQSRQVVLRRGEQEFILKLEEEEQELGP